MKKISVTTFFDKFFFSNEISGSFNQPNFGEYPQSSVSSVGFAQSRLLNDPLVTNVAMQYGQAIVASGRQIMDKELEKYVAVSRLKYYFAVDTAYVSKKLSIILFPYLHSVYFYHI